MATDIPDIYKQAYTINRQTEIAHLQYSMASMMMEIIKI